MLIGFCRSAIPSSIIRIKSAEESNGRCLTGASHYCNAGGGLLKSIACMKNFPEQEFLLLQVGAFYRIVDARRNNYGLDSSSSQTLRIKEFSPAASDSSLWTLEDLAPTESDLLKKPYRLLCKQTTNELVAVLQRTIEGGRIDTWNKNDVGDNAKFYLIPLDYTPSTNPSPPPSLTGCLNQCPSWNGQASYIKYNGDCGRFCRCNQDGSQTELSCPGGLNFNSNLQICDWPATAGCVP